MSILTVNAAVYYHDLWCLHERPEDLAAAAAFMADYRKQGGEEYKNVERNLAAAIKHATRYGADICAHCANVFPPNTLDYVEEFDFDLICPACKLHEDPVHDKGQS